MYLLKDIQGVAPKSTTFKHEINNCTNLTALIASDSGCLKTQDHTYIRPIYTQNNFPWTDNFSLSFELPCTTNRFKIKEIFLSEESFPRALRHGQFRLYDITNIHGKIVADQSIVEVLTSR